MKRRFTIDANGQLVDREGNVLGKVVGITIEGPSLGEGGGSSSSLKDQNNPPTPQTQPTASEIDSFGSLHGRKMSTAADKWMLTSAINAVWGHYAAVMKPRSDAPDDEQRKIIRDALDVATVAECKRAIDGCAASDFHMGKNDRRKKYNRLSQILKGKRGGRTTREQIDMFLEIAENGGSQSGVTSADHARVVQAKRDVLDGFEFPNDEHVVGRANEAKAWLREQGWTIEYEENGRPHFGEPS